MPFKFNGLTMPGIVLKGYEVAAPDRRQTRETFPGVDGEAEIVLGLGGRNILVPILVCDRTLKTPESVWALLRTLDRRAREPTKGDLEITLAYHTETYPNCVYERYRRLHDILPGFAGPIVGPNLTWFVAIVCEFRQLKYDEKA